MHLLSAQAGQHQQEGEAIDLGQTPGRIVFVSAADSELSAMAGAVDRAGRKDVRLANFLRLSNNLSVDLWIEQTVRHAELVIVRLLGGPSYWPYGVDELCALAMGKNLKLALLPGDANADPLLLERSTISEAEWQTLHGFFTAGGPDNFDALLTAFGSLADGATLTGIAPRPFARFGCWEPGKGMVEAFDSKSGPYAPILFYRAALEGAGTATIEALIGALEAKGLTPMPLVISSLKEGACLRFVKSVFAQYPPQVILNLTGFALGIDGLEDKQNPFAETNAPVVQLVQSGRPEAQWAADMQGLSAKDLAMQIVLPEIDGRIGALLVGHKSDAVWHDATQCPLTAYAPDADGVMRAAELAANWVRLRQTERSDCKIGIVLANYPIRDGRLANGVGYDAPQSTVEILEALEAAGYRLTTPLPTSPARGEVKDEDFVDAVPQAEPDTLPSTGRVGEGWHALAESGNALIEALQKGPTNARPERGASPAVLTLKDYAALFSTLPDKIRDEVTARWGDAKADPFCRADGFHLPVLLLGNVAIMLQPSRGYDLDEEASYHDPDLVPPHAYCAAYLWLKHRFGAQAVIHNGKHGNLEWLPGKATALDAASYPLALWGCLPHLYPFIVNDPGEGTQAKRRTGAVIIDHLVPPLTRAETYGPLKDLEALLDEYYAASGMDKRRLGDLQKRILDFTRDTALDRDIGLPEDGMEALQSIDNFLCELKEAQIRDGLHVFGQSPEGALKHDLTVALARVPRGEEPGEASLIRALADDLKLGFDPLTAKLGEAWTGPKIEGSDFTPLPTSPARGEVSAEDLAEAVPQAAPDTLPLAGRAGVGGISIRTNGDAVEYLEALAADLVEGCTVPDAWQATKAVLDTVETVIKPKLEQSGSNEIRTLLDGLDGKFVAPGPSGAPSRGRLDVLPTGRNFYSVDNRAVPTPTAWELGKKSAENLLARHFQDQGVYLQSLALSVWGTANMRTGGDDIAQALAFIGARPKWDPASLRVSGYEIIPLAKLGRPRVDVTLRISGLFRDAFPQLIALFDRAVRAIGALDEPEDQNPIAARMRSEALGLMRDGKSEEDAALQAGHRIFGSKPGAYGAGLQGLMDSGQWQTKSDLAEAFTNWGHYAYGAKSAGTPERAHFKKRLSAIEAVVHNQDNREHDLLDSDDYYQFEGGLTATAEALTGHKPLNYHNDHSRPERPLTRTLEEEISLVMRSRVVNPKWIGGVMRHGYKGAFEIIATVDYMFAFAATTGAVKTHHFDLAFDAFVLDDQVRTFLEANNRYGYEELLAKFREARDRGFWQPKSNAAHAMLARA